MTDHVALKAQAFGLLHDLAREGSVADVYQPDAAWNGCHPFNERTGVAEIAEVWDALRRSMPDLERRDMIFVSGDSKHDPRMGGDLTGRPLVATMGVYQGTMRDAFCAIPATQGVVQLRYCEVHYLQGARIAHSYVLWDLLDLMRQCGVWPLVPSLGAEGQWLGPATGDGVRLDRHDPARGDAAFDVVVAMHNALLSFDGVNLDSMDHGAYWTENFLWYGAGGIGTTRGMAGFRAHHQIPFLTGFRDRMGSGHYVRVADGDYVVTGGWPSVQATHTGEWLGIAATGKRIDMRVMDFYRLDGDRIAENWVPMDILWMLKQMGVDVFARLAHKLGQPAMVLPQPD